MVALDAIRWNQLAWNPVVDVIPGQSQDYESGRGKRAKIVETCDRKDRPSRMTSYVTVKPIEVLSLRGWKQICRRLNAFLERAESPMHMRARVDRNFPEQGR